MKKNNKYYIAIYSLSSSMFSFISDIVYKEKLNLKEIMDLKSMKIFDLSFIIVNNK